MRRLRGGWKEEDDLCAEEAKFGPKLDGYRQKDTGWIK